MAEKTYQFIDEIAGDDAIHFKPRQSEVNDEYVERKVTQYSIRGVPRVQSIRGESK